MVAGAGWLIEEFKEIDSTQDELRRRLGSGQDVHRLVIRAGVQTRGRGQRSRDWASVSGGSYQSAALKGPALPASSLFIALGVARQLNAALPLQPLLLKWPNDIRLKSGAKVAGVLCEYSRGHLLVGVGVNVANEPPAGAAAVPGLGLDDVNRLVLSGIEAGWRLMQDSPEELPAAYARLDSLHGQLLRFERGGRIMEGTAAGITAAGQLRLVGPEGETVVDSALALSP